MCGSGGGARDVARTHELEQSARLEGAGGQHLQAGGLDDDEHVLVLERDVETLRGLGLAPRRAVEFELVAGPNLVASRNASTVHEHSPELDRLTPCLFVGVSEARDVVSEHGVARIQISDAAAIDVASIRVLHPRILPRRGRADGTVGAKSRRNWLRKTACEPEML